MKKVSIVLPTYNGERFLRDSIESVINQTYQNWELIIVNDCSTDNTLEIINEYIKKDDRIRVISNESNLKLPASLNVGFKNATGDYYTWTSDDNLYKNNAIQYMVEYLNNNKEIDLICCNIDVVDENLNKICVFNNYDEMNLSRLIANNNIGACFMYRKEIAQKVGEYDVNTFCAEDYDYWCRIAIAGNIHYSDENLYIYRHSPNSLSVTKRDIVIEKALAIRLKYFKQIMDKAGISSKEQVKTCYEFYKKEQNKNWLTIAESIDSGIVRKLKLCDSIFSVEKTTDRKIITILGIKMKLKRKRNKVSFLEQIFSVKNNENKKVVRILGIKISFKRKSKIEEKPIDYLKKYNLAKKWIEKYTVDNKGIAVESNQPETIYPECTGYYIPTLLKFGDRKRAVNFGNYLISIQNNDGSWNESKGKTPYTFDTGMILKGLSALVENNLDENDKYKNALIKGADYILSMQREDGSIATANYDAWGLPYGKRVPEAIHIYCLEPIRFVGKITQNPKYENCIQKALNHYLAKEDLADFAILSHFNAYIIEGLIDIGETKRAKRAMDLISLHQRENGMVPAYSFIDFVCSTGLFQYAICWYKLGEIEKADKAFNYAMNLQNESGGFFGSYTVGKDSANYFPKGEIDWAVKYFLDAIYYGSKAKYEDCAHIFLETIDDNDERYTIIEKEIKDEKYQKILDLGCGKARYTKKLIEKYPNKEFFLVDLSKKVLEYSDFKAVRKQGSILNIPFCDNEFDFIYITEALEHAIDIENAIKEIARVLKPNGKIIIIDKDIKRLGQLKLADFEQWFDKKGLSDIMIKNGLKTVVRENLFYENKRDGLFNAWIGEK